VVKVGILLARYSELFTGGKTELTFSVPSPITVSELINILGIPSNCISFAAVNGEKRDFSYKIQREDEIILFPYIIGG